MTQNLNKHLHQRPLLVHIDKNLSETEASFAMSRAPVLSESFPFPSIDEALQMGADDNFLEKLLTARGHICVRRLQEACSISKREAIVRKPCQKE